MKTYAESRNVPTFDWNDFLRRAKANQITQTESEDASVVAGSWVSCACGNQCDAIPRYKESDLVEAGEEFTQIGEPKDAELSRLGMIFHRLIEAVAWDSASQTLEKIEIRAKEILDALA